MGDRLPARRPRLLLGAGMALVLVAVFAARLLSGPGTLEAAGDPQLLGARSAVLQLGTETGIPLTRVTGLLSESQVRELQQTTKDGRVVIIKSLGAAPEVPGQVVITHNASSADPFAQWRQQVLDGDMARARQSSSVVLYDESNRELMRFNLVNSWPSKLAWSPLKTGEPKPVTATLTLEHEGLTADVSEGGGHPQPPTSTPTHTPTATPTTPATADPPVTSAIAAPAANAAGWNKEPVTVTLSAVGAAGGPGVKEIVYSTSGDQITPSTTVAGASASVTITAPGTTTLSYFARSNTDSAETAKTLTVKIDMAGPGVTAAVAPSPNANGWVSQDATVSFTCTDDRSGVAGCPAPVAITTEGAANVASGTAVDVAGNQTSASVIVKLDKTPPTISGTATSAPNAAGWYKDPVTVHFTCADGLSGVVECPADATLSGDGAGQNVPASVSDRAGLTADTNVGGINIDRTAPTVVYGNNQGTYSVDQQVSITCTAQDALSGLASPPCSPVTGPAYDFTVGANTIKTTATDKAGNTTEASTTFTVQVTAAGMTGLIDRLITNRGEANSFKAQLNSIADAGAKKNAQAKDNALKAFLNHLEAQAGKAITAQNAATLKRLAEAM